MNLTKTQQHGHLANRTCASVSRFFMKPDPEIDLQCPGMLLSIVVWSINPEEFQECFFNGFCRRRHPVTADRLSGNHTASSNRSP
jgi:hypothetical protein